MDITDALDSVAIVFTNKDAEHRFKLATEDVRNGMNVALAFDHYKLFPPIMLQMIAIGAITRLEDMGVPDYLVADALGGVIAQRLVKRLCPACKKKGRTNPKEMEILGLDEPTTISRPAGCQFCNHTGYKGRIAIHEILYLNTQMRELVAKNKNVEQLRDLASQNGMISLWDSCRSLVLKGVTSLQELMTLNIE